MPARNWDNPHQQNRHISHPSQNLHNRTSPLCHRHPHLLAPGLEYQGSYPLYQESHHRLNQQNSIRYSPGRTLFQGGRLGRKCTQDQVCKFRQDKHCMSRYLNRNCTFREDKLGSYPRRARIPGDRQCNLRYNYCRPYSHSQGRRAGRPRSGQRTVLEGTGECTLQ